MAAAALIVSGISLIIAAISLSITWRKNVKDREYANDKELLEQLKQSLELAHRSLATDNNGFPINNRLRWLAAARHISRYRQLQSSLRTSLYKVICDEQEEYWRNRVYNLLQRVENSHFFEYINPDEMTEEMIEPKSAAIVYSFSVWKEGMPDPLESTGFEEIVNKYNLFSPLQRHFREYIERKHPKLAEKVKKKGS